MDKEKDRLPSEFAVKLKASALEDATRRPRSPPSSTRSNR